MFTVLYAWIYAWARVGIVPLSLHHGARTHYHGEVPEVPGLLSHRAGAGKFGGC